MENVKQINILDANEKGLRKISKDNLLALSLEEMKTIQKYYKKKNRNPTDVELETLAQTWSEHCKHKTFTGLIEYESFDRSPASLYKGKNKRKITINNLLKHTIVKVTSELKKKWCISVFKDNAGIIEFDKTNALAFKVETHNHPSALEPYGGAGTGIGGVIRDILGAGLGAKPILNTDVFCFGPLNHPFKKLSEGILHPKRIFKGVVSGVRDYGNRMGIPTANGSVFFDEGYVYNPLVYCGTVGILPKNKSFKKVKPGDLIVTVGGRTGRDGIHGATFSSLSLDKDVEISAVQIGNPIVEKKVTDTILQARNKNLYRAITDCGAGGFSSAIGELGQDCGAEVYLERVPLKYAGLACWEIWLSEAQERMVLSVPPKKIKQIMEIFKNEDVEATIIGKFTNDKQLHILYKGETVGKLDMDFLHKGTPKIINKAKWKKPIFHSPCITMKKNKKDELTNILKEILSMPNIASKEWIIRQYDHEVQAKTILKPLGGVGNDGPMDACVMKPLYNSFRGVAIANGINPIYGKIDPYWMAASNIDEALRNVVCVGGNIEQTAILDNFCWGNPRKSDQMAGLLRAAQACYDMAKIYETPFISGKDSLNNEYVDSQGKKTSIPSTLLISSISIVPDIRKVISMDIKEDGNFIYILGETKPELGGSHYYLLNGFIGNNPPQVNPKQAKKTMLAIHKAIDKKLIKSCHDCSEGGIAVACAEMTFSGGLGMEINIAKVPFSEKKKDDTTLLFSESNSRFIVEIAPRKQKEFEKMMKGVIIAQIGRVTSEKKFLVYGIKEKLIISADIYDLKKSWQKPLF